MANNVPEITAPKVFKVVTGQSNTFTITVSDADNDTNIQTTVQSLPGGATFDNSTSGTATLTWNPVDSTPENLTFNAKDSKGAQAVAASVAILFCNCTHGNCLFDTLLDGEDPAGSFRRVACNCTVGWEGNACEIDYDGCSNSPCVNGTNCTDVSPMEQALTGRLFNCSNCPHGMVKDGEVCVDLDECQVNSTLNDCDQICKNKEPGYSCDCRPGFRLMADKKNCTDIDECAERSANCSQICNNIPGSYQCACLEFYQLQPDNRSCVDTSDLCGRAGLTNCTHGCTNSTGTPQCFCPDGYVYSNVTNNCEDEDECSIVSKNFCSQKPNCNNTIGGYKCFCSIGYILQTDGRSCQPCQRGLWGPGCTNDCNCKDSATVCDVSTGCAACPEGMTGGSCQVDIDECRPGSDPCDSNANCSNIVGAFSCVCHAGYKTASQTNCTEINECDSDPCQNNGQCVDKFLGYNCTCTSGFSGTHCEIDVNECTSNPCQNNGTCEDKPGRFVCKCPLGSRGVVCDEDSDECLDSNANSCDQLCNNTVGSYVCYCQPGYDLNPDGRTCNETDECLSNPCQNGGTCADRLRGYNCSCASGFTGDHCQINIDECSSNPCQNYGNCTDGVSGYNCTCTRFYQGQHCESDVDECDALAPKHDCQGTCNNTIGNYRCGCLAGFNLVGRSNCTDIDECTLRTPETARCTQKCINIDGGFECGCLPGYDLNADNSTCRDVLGVCSRANLTCADGCVNDTNGVRCFCRTGFMWNDTAKVCADQNECTNMTLNGCGHKDRCVNVPGSYNCTCRDGYILQNDGRSCRPCDARTWGAGCAKQCNCKAVDTPCNNTLGCAECAAGWTGGSCDEDINECDLWPCGANATCTNNNGSYTCQCHSGFASVGPGNCTASPTTSAAPVATSTQAVTSTTQSTGTGSTQSPAAATGSTQSTAAATGSTQSQGSVASTQSTGSGVTQAPATTIPPGKKKRKWRARFKIRSTFHSDLTVTTSSRYKALFRDVLSWFRLVFFLLSVDTTDLVSCVFSSGSIAVDAQLSMVAPENTTDQDVRDKLKNNIGVFNYSADANATIDSNTVVVAAVSATTAAPSADGTVVGVVTGLVLGFVLIVLVALLLMYAYHKRQARLNFDDRRSSYSDESEPARIPHMRSMHWQPMGPYPQGHQFDNYAYEQQRIRNITRAMNQAPKVDWSVLGGFARNKSSQMDFRGQKASPFHRQEPPYNHAANNSGDNIYSWAPARR